MNDNDVLSVGNDGAATVKPRDDRFYVMYCQMCTMFKCTACGFGNILVGLAILFGLWWLGIFLITLDPSNSFFKSFGIIQAFEALPGLWASGSIPDALVNSGYRLGMGMLFAIAIGVPIGIVMGRIASFQKLTNVPFQFMRMISPLSWEPIAVVAFLTWNDAIIFLITIAAVWPVMFSTAAGLQKVDPSWFKVAKNLGANPLHILKTIIFPAIAFDIFTGIRLALGVAWIVIIPAEFLGVTSGFGYAIQDARESMNYPNLMGVILVIGLVGYILDSILVMLIKQFSWNKK
ncbi:ABC transporter permease [Thiohalophilus sp.]|uniref:ABC transporter permease n=1 Tax=Thiohalophilus sp. TaxID=3028392 RepID=UPI002ACECC65|nr:ABC transporter permease [Thiohalophilus sp.]MDZ7803961.1 ABC transporter permease [Thiohalophilus sp.]